MESDRPYPEETSLHRKMVDSRWIDRAPVTAQQSCMLVRTSVYRHQPRQPKRPMLRVVIAAIGHACHAERSMTKLIAYVG